MVESRNFIDRFRFRIVQFAIDAGVPNVTHNLALLLRFSEVDVVTATFAASNTAKYNAWSFGNSEKTAFYSQLCKTLTTKLEELQT